MSARTTKQANPGQTTLWQTIRQFAANASEFYRAILPPKRVLDPAAELRACISAICDLCADASCDDCKRGFQDVWRDK